MTRNKMTASKRSLMAIVLMAALVWLTACGSNTPATSATAPTSAATDAAAESAPDTPTEAPVSDIASAEVSKTPIPATETVPETIGEEESTGDAEEDAAADATIVKLNLNTATSEEFLTVPNVGDRMVREFNEYRPYVSILQFRREIGKYVDDAQVAAYEEYVYVPVVPNETDNDTLQQLPGVTPEIADALIAGRPYAANQDFLDALATHVTPDELTTGESYLESE